jgi:hypothetical protein
MHEPDLKSFFSSPTMQQIEKLSWMWLTLSADVIRLEEPSKKERSQSSFYRRQYVRAASALIEGFTSMLKQSALLDPKAFSSEEVLLLREQEPLLKENGKVSVRERFVPIEANIRFAFIAYAKAKHTTFTLDCSRADWQDFKKLFTVRNRITHPRRQEELSILDEELDSIKRALEFVSKNHSAVHEAIQREMWSRNGLPEPLFQKWISWQTEVCKAAHAGVLKKEWAALRERLDAAVEEYFGKAKSNGKG